MYVTGVDLKTDIVNGVKELSHKCLIQMQLFPALPQSMGDLPRDGALHVVGSRVIWSLCAREWG
ncbi:hypothetical protein K443DRAFT_351528 [Laccaria amethystina LaAM-08-1]|uniref:Uncharacterized protein n=1 Tax=Laccaria amethystina LaAM-08-1 TaxID=1095629 RepID=A0A0C9WJH0_9AGAR|nr:hypothetical protein K443DRAFT_351528 [Laccaria amethystina LaAM-08-1]